VTSPAEPGVTPRPRPGIEAARCDSSTVVFDGRELHTLNAAATAIWNACDGVATVSEIARSLGRSFDVDEATMVGDVSAAVGRFLELGLLEAGATTVVTKPVLVPAPACASCGSGPEYEVHVVVDLGTEILTVGAPERLGGALAAALGPRVAAVFDRPDGRPSYGVVLAEPAVGRGPFGVARLHRGPDVLLRSRWSDRVVDGLLSVVSHHLHPDSAVLDALAVGDANGVVLTTPPPNRVAFEREIARRGLAVANLASVVVEPGAALLGPVDLDVDRAVLESVIGPAPAERRPEPQVLGAGRVPVRAVAVQGPAVPVSVLAELGPPVSGRPRRLRPIRDFATSVPIVSTREPEAIAALLDAG
jgi:hypothetical protein